MAESFWKNAIHNLSSYAAIGMQWTEKVSKVIRLLYIFLVYLYKLYVEMVS